MEDYKPNSNRFKEEQKNDIEEKKIEKVVTGKVITKKRSKVDRFFGEIVSEDAKNVKSYVFGEVLIPAIKKAISDRVSYRSYYDDRSSNRDNRSTAHLSAGYSYDDIILDSRGEAEEVLTRMDELMDTYGLVRVADLYDLVGITGNYTDNKYGWTNIRNAEILRVREGYMIKMPRAVPID